MFIILFYLITISNAFWFYGYDRVYRDPYSETYNNEIAQTAVITYLASRRNNEFQSTANPYSYNLILFQSIIQHEITNPDNEWNVGVWESFTYCDENENTLCLFFSDGEYCDNGYFRETSVELTCHYDTNSNDPVFFDIHEYSECVYSAKLYFPELCAEKGTNTVFLRDPADIDKIKTSSYISSKGNKINVLPYTELSGVHNIGVSIVVNEISDIIRITLQGPMDRYFGIGFGSNGMLNTYAIIVNGHEDGDIDINNVFFEQLLASHSSGYTLSPSFILEEHTPIAKDNMHQITISRKLSSSVEIDEYWLFSCIDDYIDVIWSVGKSSQFETHVAFGEDRLDFDVKEVEGYDKSQIVNGVQGDQFKLRINWMMIFVLTVLGFFAYYVVKKYKERIIEFGHHIAVQSGYYQQRNVLNRGSMYNEYGSVVDDTDVEPLIKNEL